MKKIGGLAALLALTVSGPLIAAPSFVAKPVIFEGIMKPYYVGPNLYIELPSNVVITGTRHKDCSKRPIVRLRETNQDSPQHKNKYTMLLSAWMAQTPVQLQTLGLGKVWCSGAADGEPVELVDVVIPK